MGKIGPWELAAILVIVLLIFGAKRLPEIGRAVGQTIRELKKSTQAGDGGEDKPA
ncbi:MAG: twin-arginine translocase TatA/TatE family subunit [bacterium]|nr:twin-arginine translocase TatA/TatE family subunit [bacterium]